MITVTAKNIIITGASSGLGAAIAIEYARQKAKKIYLLGRSVSRLKEVASSCHAFGTETIMIAVDVTDQIEMKTILDNILQAQTIDLLIAAAGVSANSLNSVGIKENTESIIFDTNVKGVLNTVLPTVQHMKKQNSGQVAIIGSLAGLVSLADSAPYSASKAAINSYANGLRVALKSYNIHVSLIMPGYVATPMTDVNKFAMPLRYSAQKAADIIIKGLNNQQGLIIFPKILYFALKFLNIMPYRFVDYLNKRIMNKEQNVDTHK